jgi:DNA-binding winged helix-turn-helix (wHTH) protein
MRRPRAEVPRERLEFSRNSSGTVRILSGPFVVDLDGRQLLRDGSAIRLTPKAYHLLTLLVTAAPRALSKDELQQHLWPDTFVDEANLSVLAAELRAAMADDARHPSYVRTVHGFGYAYCGTVQQEAAHDPPPQRSPAEWWLVSASGRLPLARGATIVGRDPAAGLMLESSSVSRQHARIVVDDRVHIEDLGSKNGTWVNGRRIDAPTPLDSGDEVRFGSVGMHVHRAWEGGSTETIAPIR